jgi:septal ring factor EnvC (AmiA/AmiB activator)
MRVVMALACCLLTFAGVALAQPADPSRRDAERRLQQVRGELKSVAAERRKLEGERGAASRQLRQADEQVGGIQRALRETQAPTQQRDAAALAGLQAQRARHAGDIAARRTELAGLLRAAQSVGSEAPLKAMLAQDRIADAERALTYQGYLQRARVERIRTLTAELQRIDALERAITERRTAIARDTQRQAAQLAELEQARRQRAGVLAGLDRRYQDRASREQALGRDARALQSLLAQLRATAARAAREAARARAAANRPQRANAPAPARSSVASAAPLRVGGLGWPVAGNLLAGFGGRLPDGRRSDGVLVAAAAGTAVRAVADGTVVFADWMTGYGMILIVDHGNGYMSLYAHNDGLLKQPGDAVKRGDAVASVGTSGGQAQPALYFELRRNGAPVNPAGWLTRQ